MLPRMAFAGLCCDTKCCDGDSVDPHYCYGRSNAVSTGWLEYHDDLRVRKAFYFLESYDHLWNETSNSGLVATEVEVNQEIGAIAIMEFPNSLLSNI